MPMKGGTGPIKTPKEHESKDGVLKDTSKSLPAGANKKN